MRPEAVHDEEARLIEQEQTETGGGAYWEQLFDMSTSENGWNQDSVCEGIQSIPYTELIITVGHRSFVRSKCLNGRSNNVCSDKLTAHTTTQ